MSATTSRVRTALVGALSVVAVTGCDFEVTNPGPVQDEFLNRAESQAAMVNGMGRGLAESLGELSYTGAAISREVHPSGSTGSFGITVKQQAGLLDVDQNGFEWNSSQRARFLAEDGIRRIEALDGADRDQELLNQAYLWAGYIYRMMGEHFCEGIIDAGVPGPSTIYLDRAIAWFDKAEAAGGEIGTAAIGGRASAHVMLGNWGAAIADASRVPVGFSYRMPYFSRGDDNESNTIHIASAADPYKAHTQWNTWVETYGLSDLNPNGDPRTPFRVTDEFGDAQTSCCGQTNWWPQTKYAQKDAPIDLSSYDEMRMIIAEDHLRNGRRSEAMAEINAIRSDAGVAGVTAATDDEAWTHLKREWAIVTWLEGRRLPQMRRWEADAADGGSFHPLEEVGDGDINTGAHLQTRSFCFPTPESETQTNPNLRG